MENIIPYRGDYYPILGQLMNEMNIAEEINSVIGKNNSQTKIDIGTFTYLFIHNILGDVNIRLYQMNEFFKDKALPLIIPWKPDIDLTEINDDRAGRVLDGICKADPQKVFTTVANAAIRIHKLDTNIIHSDTTSKSFEGVYENQHRDGTTPLITNGFSKDHRPDLKQILLGIGTIVDGIPIRGEVADGNESDKKFNRRWIKNFRTALNKDANEFLVYVADSSLVTTENLNLLANNHIEIISRLPGTFKIEKELKRKALENDD